MKREKSENVTIFFARLLHLLDYSTRNNTFNITNQYLKFDDSLSFVSNWFWVFKYFSYSYENLPVYSLGNIRNVKILKKALDCLQDYTSIESHSPEEKKSSHPSR